MKNFTLIVLVFLIASCDSKIEDKFIISNRNTAKDNSNDLKKIHSDLTLTKSLFAKYEPATGNENNGKVGVLEEKDVAIRDSVKKVFDPEVCPCTLPNKIFRKLKNSKQEGKSWAPAEVNIFLNKFPIKGKYLPGKSVNALLHYVTIKSLDGSKRIWPLIGSPSYKQFDFEKYILKGSTNSFIYTLDCSGYLNAAIEAAASAPGGDIQGAAKSALEVQKSMFVGGGTLISPINAAYYGDAFTVGYSKDDRVAVLKALLDIPDLLDTDEFIIPNSYEVVWISHQGQSSFNGQASLGVSGAAGFGFASVKGSAESGGEISRKSSFTSYDTYLTANKEIPDLKPFTVKSVREVKNKLEAAN